MKRRDSIKTAVAGIAGMSTTRVYGKIETAGSRPLRLALIGCGVRGVYNLLPQMLGETVAAFSDPDVNRIKKAFARVKEMSPGTDTSKIRVFRDYRELFEKIGDQLDAVVVATPNHHHGPASILAIRHNLHVYVEKPMALTIEEVRLMHAEAKKHGVITQVGNHGHSSEGIRRLVEYIQSGAIGQIHDVWAWDDRINDTDIPPKYCDPPKELDWDTWIGPAEMRKFHPKLHPHDWHSWMGLGNGSIGNMGTHILDPAFWALKLTYPTSVVMTECRPGYPGAWSIRTTFQYDFAARDGMDPVKVHWFDGLKGNLPCVGPQFESWYGKCKDRDIQHVPEIVPELEKKYNTSLGHLGTLYIGGKGIMTISTHGEGLRFIPDDMKTRVLPPPKTIPRVKGTHMDDFFRAIRDKQPAGTDFDYSTPLAEVVLLGNVATRAGLNQKIAWNGKECTNRPDLGRYLKLFIRKGWSL